MFKNQHFIIKQKALKEQRDKTMEEFERRWNEREREKKKECEAGPVDRETHSSTSDNVHDTSPSPFKEKLPGSPPNQQ